MKTTQKIFSRTAIAVALAAAFAPAIAQQSSPGVNAPTDSNVRLGAGILSGDQRDRTIFGQYNGLRNNDYNLLLDFDYMRFDENGMGSILRGRNLGLDSREASFTTKKLGDWRLSIDYGELVHHEIRTINTADGGVGTITPQVNVLASPLTGSNTDLSLKRTSLGLSGDKWITSNLQLEVNFKTEDKTGARSWGRGYDCASYVCAGQTATNTRWATLYIAEPVDANTKQIEAKLNYTSGKLVLSGGYYGSFYNNNVGSVSPTVPANLIGPTGILMTTSAAAAGGTSLQNVLQSPMALPPDNQAHQFYVSGNYAFTPSTHSNFKASYTRATQDQQFAAQGLNGAPVNRTNLGGLYETWLLQGGITARPMAKLGLNANLRYEDRDDKTPIDTYNKENTATFTNGQSSLKKISGKAEATYQLPFATRGAIGVDYESVDRGTFTSTVALAGITAIRQKTEETGYFAELRRMMAESITGSIRYRHSSRTGDTWLKPNALPVGSCVTVQTCGVTPTSDTAIYSANGIFPYPMTNRGRDEVRATAEWAPTDRLSVQLVGQGSHDAYSAPNENRGLTEGGTRLYSLDVSYQLNDNWKLSGFASIGDTHQTNTHSTAYIADVNESNKMFGVNMAGRLTGRLTAGLSETFLKDKTHYGLSAPSGASANNVLQNSIGVPDVWFQELRFNLYANYALQKNSDIRFDLIHVNSFLDEWAWQGVGQPYFYSDNTTVGIVNRDQKVTFIGASYVYRF
ncbi:MAG TPA: MtrB/PioB family decaheme-associated outer membrane protein [Burkholderiales bacterium]|nr:MtrB/PioB family decaheme-associated outer membrane protein [Burkholderiales bacterium]